MRRSVLASRGRTHSAGEQAAWTRPAVVVECAAAANGSRQSASVELPGPRRESRCAANAPDPVHGTTHARTLHLVSGHGAVADEGRDEGAMHDWRPGRAAALVCPGGRSAQTAPSTREQAGMTGVSGGAGQSGHDEMPCKWYGTRVGGWTLDGRLSRRRRRPEARGRRLGPRLRYAIARAAGD